MTALIDAERTAGFQAAADSHHQLPTRIDPAGTKTSVATSWKSLDGYRDLLVKVLTSETTKAR